ncbi:hypothetical protein OPT61_g2611 [Boeremia exigua]|uniref:Uncharacterized protein n=1 Tax=Boeremia exigua TaxID=749465 RepID=A0ACC2IKV0_9PLEO|nr:hypothetical protein OPT61_g2611 [Boeremia exigua]
MSVHYFQHSLTTPPASPSVSPSVSHPTNPSASPLAILPATPSALSGSPSASLASTTVLARTSTSPSSLPARSPSRFPSAAREILEYLRGRNSGALYRRSYSALLTEAEKRQLEEEIYKDRELASVYLNSRLAWFPPRPNGRSRGKLVYIIPTRTHDKFCDLIESACETRIAALQKDPTHHAHRAAMDILGWRKHSIDLEDGDVNIAHIAFQYAALRNDYESFPLIVEVGLSQTSRSLNRKAKRWLRSFETKTVVTFNLPYQDRKARQTQLQQDQTQEDQSQQAGSKSKVDEATYTLHRMRNTGNNVWVHEKDQGTFRNEDGATEGSLQLTLNDFIPDSHLLDFGDEVAISISHSDMDAFLSEARRVQAVYDNQKPPKPCKGKKKCLDMSDSESNAAVSSGRDNSPPQDRKSDKDFAASQTLGRALAASFSMTTRSMARDPLADNDG